MELKTQRLPLLSSTDLKAFIVFLFFLSGASALLYEVVWTRMLTYLLGNTSYAVSMVLTAFMAGLAMGSFIIGRMGDRFSQPLKIYAYMEGAIGCFALFIPFFLDQLEQLYLAVFRSSYGNVYVGNIMRFALSFLVLFLPTSLMGATLPLMSKFFVTRWEKLGEWVGTLYGANTLGAVLGCFASGFLMIGSLGLRSTHGVAIGINLFIALLVLSLSRKLAEVAYPGQERELSLRASTPEQLEDTIYAPKVKAAVLFLFGLSGFAALAYEVLWTRALVFFMTNSTYAFTSMLTTFLLGIALGSWALAPFVDKRKDLLLLFGLVEVLIGVWAIFSLPMLNHIFYFLSLKWTIFEDDALRWFTSSQWIKFFKSFCVMFIPALLMGATFPIVSKIFTPSLKKVGRGVGYAYSMNTVGSAAGSLFAGFLLIPLLGIQKGILAIALLNLVVGAVGFSLSSLSVKAKVAGALVILGLASLALFPQEIKLRRPDEQWNKLLFYKEDSTATVKVFEKDSGDKLISINGYRVAGSLKSLHEIQKCLGHFPLLLHKNPEKALCIGFGAGGTSYSMSLYNELKELHCVEFVPSVMEAAQYLTDVNHGVFQQDKFTVFLDDGRNYLLVTDQKYDIIAVDAIDPKHSGNGNLYSKEFYQICRDKLRDDGIVAQWLPYHLLTERETKVILKTFQSVFPHTNLWFTRYFNYMIIIGTEKPLEVDMEVLRKRLSEEKIHEDLALIGIQDPMEVLSCFAMDEEGVAQYCKHVKELNTYNWPIIEFYRSDFKEHPWPEGFEERKGFPKIVNLGDTPEAISATRARLARALRVSDHLIMGRSFMNQGDLLKSLYQFREALREDPQDSSAQFLLAEGEQYLLDMKRELQQAVEQRPYDPQAHYELATLYHKTGHPYEAIEEYEKVLKLNPNHVDASLQVTRLKATIWKR